MFKLILIKLTMGSLIKVTLTKYVYYYIINHYS